MTTNQEMENNMNVEEHAARLEKIRAILAKAEATNFPEEAKAFASKAQELMARWSIDEAMLNAGKVDNTIERSDIWIDANEYRAPKVQVLSAVASANDCHLVLWPQHNRQQADGSYKRQFRVTVIGTKTDRDFVEVLYTSLILQVTHELTHPQTIAQMQLDCDCSGHTIRWRNTFVNGYAAAIRTRLMESRQRAHTQAKAECSKPETMALVLRSKSEMVIAKRDEFFPKLGKSKGSSAGQGAGAATRMGYEAGKRADIGNPKISAASRKRISA